jgi:hypothetical protein
MLCLLKDFIAFFLHCFPWWMGEILQTVFMPYFTVSVKREDKPSFFLFLFKKIKKGVSLAKLGHMLTPEPISQFLLSKNMATPTQMDEAAS